MLILTLLLRICGANDVTAQVFSYLKFKTML